jgi:hypothetical protein
LYLSSESTSHRSAAHQLLQSTERGTLLKVPSRKLDRASPNNRRKGDREQRGSL